MLHSEENRAQPRSGRALVMVAAALLCAAVLQSNLAYTAPTATEGFTGADLAASTVADFTPAASTGVDFTPAGSTTEDWADFTPAVSTALLPACTIDWDIRMAATGTMAGTMDATAGGGVVTGWDGLTIRIPGGVPRTTETTTTTSLTLPSPGTTVPIRQATIRTSRSVIRTGRPFQPAEAARPNPHPGPSVEAG
jgi:hypothetical protein